MKEEEEKLGYWIHCWGSWRGWVSPAHASTWSSTPMNPAIIQYLYLEISKAAQTWNVLNQNALWSLSPCLDFIPGSSTSIQIAVLHKKSHTFCCHQPKPVHSSPSLYLLSTSLHLDQHHFWPRPEPLSNISLSWTTTISAKISLYLFYIPINLPST